MSVKVQCFRSYAVTAIFFFIFAKQKCFKKNGNENCFRTDNPDSAFILTPISWNIQKKELLWAVCRGKGKGGEKNGEKSPFQPLLPLDLCIFGHLESAADPKLPYTRNLVGGKPVLLTRRYSFQDQCRNWYGTYPTPASGGSRKRKPKSGYRSPTKWK